MTKKTNGRRTRRTDGHEKKPIAAFQGELGAFSHAAAKKLLGENVGLLPCPHFGAVFEALRTGDSTHAVLPIENTLHGSVHENYDHLLEYELPIIGETNIRISHQLIAMPGTRFRDVVRVFSHPVALNQCLSFFHQHPEIEKTPHYDTAGSVKMLRDQPVTGSAAIASEAAAAIYGGVILKRNIEDDRKNFTRFFLLGSKQNIMHRSEQRWKTSLVFSTPNAPGALFKAMACFALRDVNLTKLESRPLRGRPWEYLFYLDLNGHCEEPRVLKAIANLGEITSFLRVLGSYQPTE
ncbi:MAG: prephenate dehydratase [Bryobacteraceae bacterium]